MGDREHHRRASSPQAQATIRIEPGDLDQRPVPEHIVARPLRLRRSDASRYFETMPPLTGVAGSATFTGRRMDFEVARGRVGEVAVDHGSVVITGIGIKGRDTTQLEVAAQISSPLAAALALIDHPPLGFASKLGVAPTSASGHGRDPTSPSACRCTVISTSRRCGSAVSAELRDAGVRACQDLFDLSAGRFSLTVDDQHAELVGEGAINQIPLADRVARELRRRRAVQAALPLSGTIDAGATERFGLDAAAAGRGRLRPRRRRWSRPPASARRDRPRSRRRSRSTCRGSAGRRPTASAGRLTATLA